MRLTLKALVVCVVLMTVATVTLAQEAAGGLRYSITVSKFENKAGWYGQWDIGDAWGTVLTDMLNQTGRFIVLGESDMRQEAMGEQDLGASGRTAGGAKTAVTGQMTPAQLLVKGAITHVQGDTAGAGGVSIGVGSAARRQERSAHTWVDSTGRVWPPSVVGGQEAGARYSQRQGAALAATRTTTSAGGQAACAEAVSSSPPSCQHPLDRLSGHGQDGQVSINQGP
jgi:hypothetical protein